MNRGLHRLARRAALVALTWALLVPVSASAAVPPPIVTCELMHPNEPVWGCP